MCTHHRADPAGPTQPVEKESELIAVAQAAEHLMVHVWSKLTLPVATGVGPMIAEDGASRNVETASFWPYGRGSGIQTATPRPAAEASTDMTPRVIAAGLNRRGPGARRLPNDRFRAPECILTWTRMRSVAQPNPPNRDEWPRCRSMLDCATVFGGWEV